MFKPSLSEIENYAKDSSLSTTVRELGNLLGEVIIEQEGEEIFRYVEDLRALAKQLRNQFSTETLDKIKEITATLSLDEAMRVVKAFSIYFILVNSADEIYSLRKKREKLHNRTESEPGTLIHAFTELKETGFTESELADLLKKIEITPVFTAHPTEASRQTVMRKILRICELLAVREEKKGRHFDIIRRLKAEITLLWQTNDVRTHKVSVSDEVQRGLFFLKDVIYDRVDEFYHLFYYSLRAGGFELSPGDPVIKFGSWIGGDRDGHPFVTTGITRDTLERHREAIIRLYREELDRIYTNLSNSVNNVPVSKALNASINHDLKELKAEEMPQYRDATELYRKKLILIYEKLGRTLTRSEGGYPDADEFIADLELIADSLMRNKGELVAETLLHPFIYKVKTFGFHFVKLDIRQNASRIRDAVEEILFLTATSTGFRDLTEEQKIRVLRDEILSPRPLVNKFSNLSENAATVLDEIGLIKWAAGNISVHAGRDYIISNCSSVSDVLSVLLLAKETGLVRVEEERIVESNIDILPLFETISDLRNASTVLRELFELRVYRRHVRLRGKVQKVMIGYSDSNKDGGIVTSNYELFRVQSAIADLCREYKIEPVIFHGRGGSISRGGGPVYDSIIAKPTASLSGRIKITEQGEMISAKYLIPETALGTLELTSSAVITKTAEKQEDTLSATAPGSEEILQKLSDYAFAKYRALLEHPGFIDYFRLATPIDIIEQLEIGSRPGSRRVTKDPAALRAIPWVFAWTQNRNTISGWFGYGSAVEATILNEHATEADLVRLYNTMPFFKVLTDNVEMVLFKTDMIIGREYSRLANTPGAPEIFRMIKDEYDRSVSAVLLLTGEKYLLGNNKDLQRRLQLRNPYIDPVSFIQLRFIDEWRKGGDAGNEALLTLLRSTVNGIAAGIRNTG
ncbi:MAG: phosphoenolpyruvate carboxylase [Ignavibacteriaceae bacterium]|nr:MAG: phosphoenolpyruvate carboxylase [Ignavibacteriaceae bacterium]